MFDDNVGVGLILDLYLVVRCKKLFPSQTGSLPPPLKTFKCINPK